MSALFSQASGIPGIASSSSAGPARAGNNIFIGASGGSTTDLARFINVSMGAQLNGGFTGALFPSEDDTFVSPLRNLRGPEKGLNVGWLALGGIAIILAVIFLSRK